MIIFLYGDDTYRSRQKLKELKEKYLREVDPQGHSLLTVDGESIRLEKMSEILTASSLFAKKRMVIIERIFLNKSKNVLNYISEYLKKISVKPFSGKSRTVKNPDTKSAVNENIIVFWENTGTPGKLGAALWQALAKERFAQNFKTLSNTEAANWVKEEVLRLGGKIRQPAVIRLTGLIGSDIWLLKNEIDKLFHFKEGQSAQLLAAGKEIVIEVADVENLVIGALDENIFALTDAIGNKNKREAVRLFEHELEAGITESNLLHMILRQFRTLLLIRQELDKGQTARKMTNLLKLHPFVVQKSLNQVRNFSLAMLKNIFFQLVRIDKEIKTGQVEAKTALSMLLAKI